MSEVTRILERLGKATPQRPNNVAASNLARLWHAVGNGDLFRAARDVLPADASLVENARLFALLGIECCDSLISVFDAKYP